jgi:hypothetical protein
MGVRRESVLTKYLDVARQNPIDFMHQSYRGVVDKILHAILQPTSRANRQSWNISNSRNDVAALDQIQLQVCSIQFNLSEIMHSILRIFIVHLTSITGHNCHLVTVYATPLSLRYL